MARTSRWKVVAGAGALGGAAFLMTGSVAYAEPRPVDDGIELRLLVDDCPASVPNPATAP
ncbi:hypothetical protein [Streptosporangium fragile]